ncbi:hypothetical protein MNBD_GAMMA09-2624 [hydrothermal vent metagenome]|uniref:ZipA C-terminal FtsZ-binding domain-containing protein n=1 Tax=hydrothermal vent metagenome TaxID=652676 RepID=A0A3B0XGC3_9ZZZZ
MDDLRWILLAIALLVIAAIFFLSRSRKKDSNTFTADTTDEMPSFSAEQSTESDWVDSVGPVRVVTGDSSRVHSRDNARADLSAIQNESITARLVDIDEAELKAKSEPGSKQENGAQKDILSEVEPEALKKSSTDNQPVTDKQLENNSVTGKSAINESIATYQSVLPETHKPPAVTAEAPPVSVAEDETPAQDDVIAVYVLATSEMPVMKGDKILSASYSLHLEHGDMKIFHFSDEVTVNGVTKNEIQFSMANLHEPGWFDIENINQLETRGLSFFMQVGLVENPAAVLDEMFICAHKMSTMLGARLCNAQRKPLDEAYTKHLRNKVKRLMELKAGNT